MRFCTIMQFSFMVIFLVMLANGVPLMVVVLVNMLGFIMIAIMKSQR